MKLTGKAALVSGAGGGIGRAICLAFAEAEAAIACCDLDAASAEETSRLARNARRVCNPPALRFFRSGADRSRCGRNAAGVRAGRYLGERRRSPRSRAHL